MPSWRFMNEFGSSPSMNPKPAIAPSPAYCNAVSGQGVSKNLDSSRNETAPAGMIITKPRSILLSPRRRRPRSVIPKSSGMARGFDQDDLSQSVCRHPAGMKAVSRKEAHESASGSFTSQDPLEASHVGGPRRQEPEQYEFFNISSSAYADHQVKQAGFVTAEQQQHNKDSLCICCNPAR